MNLLITGADRPLGKCAVQHFQKDHALRLVGRTGGGGGDAVDLRLPDQVAERVVGIDAVLHLDVFDPDIRGQEDHGILDWAAQGTFVLMQEARRAGVARVVLASALDVFAAYPEAYVIDETWQPQPSADAVGLAPYLAELTCREFARQGGISAICVRMGTLGDSEGTTPEDAMTALDGALNLPLDATGYRWHLFHVSSGNRFPMRLAKRALGFAPEGA